MSNSPAKLVAEWESGGNFVAEREILYKFLIIVLGTCLFCVRYRNKRNTIFRGLPLVGNVFAIVSIKNSEKRKLRKIGKIENLQILKILEILNSSPSEEYEKSN